MANDARTYPSELPVVALRQTVVFPLTLQPDLTDPIMRGETVIVDDVRGDSPNARRYREALGAALEAPAFNYVRSWVAVPLMLQDRVVGMLTMSKGEAG